jgi:hypothetical protein
LVKVATAVLVLLAHRGWISELIVHGIDPIPEMHVIFCEECRGCGVHGAIVDISVDYTYEETRGTP